MYSTVGASKGRWALLALSCLIVVLAMAWGLAFASSGLAIALSPLVLATMGRRAARSEPST